MKTRKGVALVTYRQSSDSRNYLILKRDKNWRGWELPKGGLEYDNYLSTAFLELNEEAGIEPVEIESISELDKELTWTYDKGGKSFKSRFKVFLVEVKNSAKPDVSKNPSEEHKAAAFYPFGNAMDLLKHNEQKRLLEKAHKLEK